MSVPIGIYMERIVLHSSPAGSVRIHERGTRSADSKHGTAWHGANAWIQLCHGDSPVGHFWERDGWRRSDGLRPGFLVHAQYISVIVSYGTGQFELVDWDHVLTQPYLGWTGQRVLRDLRVFLEWLVRLLE